MEFIKEVIEALIIGGFSIYVIKSFSEAKDMIREIKKKVDKL